MPNPNVYRKSLLPFGFDNALFAYNQALTTKLTPSRKYIVNALIISLKYSGVWSQLDALWLLATNTQQGARINLINPTATAITEVNSPAWVADQGYTSNGTTSYLDTNYNTSTGTNFVLNSGSLFTYIRTNVAETLVDIGSVNVTVGSQIISRNATDSYSGRVNSTTTTAIGSTDSRGLSSTVRSDSATQAIYKNGLSVASGAVASSATANLNLYVCCRNITGIPGSYSTKQIAIAGIGGGDINQLALYNCIQTYMTSIRTAV